MTQSEFNVLRGDIMSQQLSPGQVDERIRQLEVQLEREAKQADIYREAAARAAQQPSPPAPEPPPSWVHLDPAQQATQAWQGSKGIPSIGLTRRPRQ